MGVWWDIILVCSTATTQQTVHTNSTGTNISKIGIAHKIGKSIKIGIGLYVIHIEEKNLYQNLNVICLSESVLVRLRVSDWVRIGIG